MDKSIRQQLRTYFILFSVILSIIFIGSTAFIVRRTFDQYKSNNIEANNQQIVNYISDHFDPISGYDQDLATNLSIIVQQRQVDLTLYDQNKKIIWTREYMKGHMGHMRQRGNLVTTQYPLIKEGLTFGYVDLRQSASSFLTQEDALFLRNLFFGTLLASGIGLLIASTIALRYSKKLSKPLTELKDIAQGIKAGDLSLRANNHAHISEYKEVSEAINDMTETLEKQRLLRRTLANNISHELRTPLYVMKTHLEALSDGIISPNEETYQTIIDEINQLSHIVSDLEQLNDLEEDVSLNKEDTDLRSFLTAFLQSYEGIIESQHKHLSFQMEASQEMAIDQKRIRQVLSNLMSNALRFTTGGDVIRLRVIREGDFMALFFRDSGRGISSEDLPYVFERFYRSAIKNNTLENGAGLGLSIAKEIINQHGGSITVDSQANQYTEFKILLPLKASS